MDLKAENEMLRQALSDVVAGLRNGGAASPAASLDFLCDGVPREVALVCAANRRLIERLCWALKSSAPPSRELLELAEHHIAAVDTTHVLCGHCGRMVLAQAVCKCRGE